MSLKSTDTQIEHYEDLLSSLRQQRGKIIRSRYNSIGEKLAEFIRKEFDLEMSESHLLPFVSYIAEHSKYEEKEK